MTIYSNTLYCFGLPTFLITFPTAKILRFVVLVTHLEVIQNKNSRQLFHKPRSTSLQFLSVQKRVAFFRTPWLIVSSKYIYKKKRKIQYNVQVRYNIAKLNTVSLSVHLSSIYDSRIHRLIKCVQQLFCCDTPNIQLHSIFERETTIDDVSTQQKKLALIKGRLQSLDMFMQELLFKHDPLEGPLYRLSAV